MIDSTDSTQGTTWKGKRFRLPCANVVSETANLWISPWRYNKYLIHGVHDWWIRLFTHSADQIRDVSCARMLCFMIAEWSGNSICARYFPTMNVEGRLQYVFWGFLGTDGFKYFPGQDPATRKNMELHLDNLRMLGSLHHFEKDIILSPDLALHRKLDVGLPWRSFVELPRLQFPRMLNLGICARMGVHTQLVPWQEPGTSHANCGLRFCQGEEGPFFPRSFAPNRCFCFQSPSATLERECLDKVWRNRCS